MYSLDINFLKDRPDYSPPKGPRVSSNVPNVQQAYYQLAGIGVGVAIPALTLGLWFIISGQNEKLAAEGAKLDGDLGSLGNQVQQLESIEAQTKQVSTQTQFFASIFNTTVKPLPALLQDLRDRLPPQVQISNIKQTLDKTPPEAIQATAPWSIVQQKIEIKGRSTNFDRVNDFVLTIKRSPFFNETDTKLVEAKLIDNPTKVCEASVAKANNNEPCTTPTDIELPKVVEYTIQTIVSNVPADKVVADLDRTGAVGLSTRVKTLEQQGVIKP